MIFGTIDNLVSILLVSNKTSIYASFFVCSQCIVVSLEHFIKCSLKKLCIIID